MSVPQRTFLALIASSDPWEYQMWHPGALCSSGLQLIFPLDHSVAAALAGNQRLSAKLRQQTELWRMGAVMKIQQRRFQDGKLVRDPH